MRVLASLIVAVVVGLFVLGCGGDEPAQPEPRTAEQRAEVEEQPEQQDRAEPEQQSEPAAAQQQEDQADAPERAPAAQQAQTQTEPDASVETTAETADPDRWGSLMVGGARPAALFLPDGAERSEPLPLVILLHGYSSNAFEADLYFGFSELVDEDGFGLLLPDGTTDAAGLQFWNATPECCDIYGAEPDDVGYIKSIIVEAGEHANFDQVFAVGHSNGGFMAYRLACEEVPGLTAIVSLAGAAFADESECRAPSPLSVLQIHGTEDGLVLYEGGRLPAHPDPDRAVVPGAKESITRWAERAGCDTNASEKLPPLDTDDTAVAGSETSVYRIAEGCLSGVTIELWTIEGGGHVPLVWETQFRDAILHWLGGVYLNAAKASAPDAGGEPEQITIGGERTAELVLPSGHGEVPIPLVVSLHGYGGDAEIHDWYFGLSERVAEYGFALITPEGTVDERGNRFWNATDSCCNFHGSEVDDYGWMRSLVAEAAEMVDLSGVYLVGHSNGGFMSYRMACDGLDGLAAIVSLAGSSFGDPARCDGAAPVSVLQVHGTADVDIPYEGTLEYDGGYPGAVELVERWGERAVCDLDEVEQLEPIDLDASIDGSETTVQRTREGCVEGITIELWTIAGGSHGPDFQADWSDHLLRWLFDESRAN